MSHPPPQTHMHYRAGVITIGLLVLLVDEATKAYAASVWAKDPVSLLGGRLILTESRNAGAAFGTATSLTPVLTAIAAAAAITVLVAAARARGRVGVLTLGLVLGGALGNFTDRMLRSPGPARGHVVDWIQVGWWPTFNLADSSLVTAAVIGLLLAGRTRRG